MNVKMTFSAVSAAVALCCGVFVCTASAQNDDFWGDSSPREMSMPDEPAPGWEPLSDLEEKPENDKTGKAAKPAKSPKQPKTAKAPKPQKTAKPKAAPVGGDDRTLNAFVNIGPGFGIGAYKVEEVDDNPNLKGKDYYMNMSQGLRFEAGAGYMATPNLETRFSVDLNFGLFAPNDVEYNVNNNVKNVFNYSYFSWGIKAMVVPQFEVLEMLDMYVGSGLSLNFAYGTKTKDSTYTAPNLNNTVNTVYKMQFSPAVGFCGLVGFTLPLSDMMDFFGELQFESKGFTLYKELVDDYKNNLDPGGNLTPSDVEYKKNDREYPAPPLYSGSNWGLRGGLRFWFGL